LPSGHKRSSIAETGEFEYLMEKKFQQGVLAQSRDALYWLRLEGDAIETDGPNISDDTLLLSAH
jgi:hypothetical protein